MTQPRSPSRSPSEIAREIVESVAQAERTKQERKMDAARTVRALMLSCVIPELQRIAAIFKQAGFQIVLQDRLPEAVSLVIPHEPHVDDYDIESTSIRFYEKVPLIHVEIRRHPARTDEKADDEADDAEHPSFRLGVGRAGTWEGNVRADFENASMVTGSWFVEFLDWVRLGVSPTDGTK